MKLSEKLDIQLKEKYPSFCGFLRDVCGLTQPKGATSTGTSVPFICVHEGDKGGNLSVDETETKGFNCFSPGCKRHGHGRISALMAFGTPEQRTFGSFTECLKYAQRLVGDTTKVLETPTEQVHRISRESLYRDGGFKVLEELGTPRKTAERLATDLGFFAKAPYIQGATEQELLDLDFVRAGEKGLYSPLKQSVVFWLNPKYPNEWSRRSVNPRAHSKHMHCKKKHAVLWRLCRAVESMKAGKLEKIVLVESPLDTSAIEGLVDACGMTNRWVSVASLGTQGMNPENIPQALLEVGIKKDVEILIVPDNDAWRHKETGAVHAPGQTSGITRAEYLEKAGYNVRLMILDEAILTPLGIKAVEGMDARDLATKSKISGKQFLKLVASAVSTLEYKLFCRSRYCDLSTEGGRQSFWSLAKTRITQEYKGRELPSELAAFVARIGGLNPAEVRLGLNRAIGKTFAQKWAAKRRAEGVSKEEFLRELGWE